MGAVAGWRPVPTPLRCAVGRPGARGPRGATGRRRDPADPRPDMTDLHGLATRALHVLDPEDAHTAAIAVLKLGLGPVGPKDDPVLATELAAGGERVWLPLSNPIR